MSKKSSLRKSLIASVLSLTLSASMLVGTTFAWFTDSVTSTGNRIQAGTLDVDLYKIEADGKEEEVTNDSDAIFDYALWEPGYSDAVVLKVVNDGTLALKFKLDVVLTGSFGDADITDVIEVWSTTPSTTAIEYPTSFDGYTYRGTLTDMMAEDDGAVHGNLASKAFAYQGIILKMSEEAGNEYQGAVAEFDIRLNATQYTAETDGFSDPNYDADADYDGEASNETSLKAALEKGESVKLINNIEVTEQIKIPAGAKSVLNLNGYNINNAEVSSVIRSEGDLTITGSGTINTTGSSYGIRAQSGNLVIDSANVNVIGTFGAVSAFKGANVTINGGSFTSTGAAGKTHHCVYAGSGANVTINGGTFEHRGAGTSDSGAVITVYDYNNIGNTSITINGGTFIGSGTYIQCLAKWAGDLNVKGGTFSTDPTSCVVSGFETTKNSDGTWTVAPYKVASVSELTSNIAAGKSVTLTSDIESTETLTVAGDQDVVIDLNGKTFSSPKRALKVDGSANVKIKNGTVNSTDSFVLGLFGDASIVAENCTFIGLDGFGMNGSTTSENSYAEFINCTFKITGSYNAAYISAKGTYIFKDCVLEGGSGIEICSGNVTLDGCKIIANGYTANGKQPDIYANYEVTATSVIKNGPAYWEPKKGEASTGDCVTIVDRRGDGYELKSVTIKNCVFEVKSYIESAEYTGYAGYAVRYYDKNASTAAKVTPVFENNVDVNGNPIQTGTLGFVYSEYTEQ